MHSKVLLCMLFTISVQSEHLILKSIVENVNLNLIEIVVKIINLDLEKRFTTLNLITVPLSNESLLAADYSSNILSHFTNGDFALRLENYHTIWSLKRRRRFYNTYLVDSSGSFNKLLEQISHDKFNNDGYFMFVIINGSLANILNIFQKLWMKYIYNVLVLIEDENSIKLLTFFPYFSNHCNDTRPFLINQLKNASFPLLEHFPNKFQNLFECPIKVGAHSTPPSIIQQDVQLTGYEMELLNELAKTMNFHKDIEFFPGKAPWGRIYENGSSTGALNRAINGDVDMLIGNYNLFVQRLKFLSASRSCFSNQLILIVPPGKEFSSLEKLFKPFESTVWMLLIGVVVVGIFMITLIKFQMPNVGNLVFGKGISNHYFNILLIFVGGSQHIIPQRNFSRFLLMMFLLLCFVQRNLYQGYLIQFMQSENRAKEVSTIDEMIEKNFDFYMYDSFQEISQSMKLHER